MTAPSTAPDPGSRPRRRWLRRVAAVLAVLLVVGVAGTALLWRSIRIAAADTDFALAMPVPPLAASTMDAQGRRVFDLTVQ